MSRIPLPALVAAALVSAATAAPAAHAPQPAERAGAGGSPFAAGVGEVRPAGSRPSRLADTSVVARRGDALVVETLEGRLHVEGWDQDRVTVEGRDVTLRRDGSRVALAGVGRGRERVARLRVPRWMPVTVSGRELEVEVASVEAPVSLRTLEGDLRVSRVRGPVTLRSVDGDIWATDIEGTVSALAVGDAVYLRRVRGDVRAESTDGDLVLEEVDGTSVEAVTVDGDVTFDGPLRRGGRYRFVTHDGNVTVLVPRSAAADVTVSTYDGEFAADFPVVLDGYRGGRKMSFSVGGGGASLEIQAFDGDIRLGWR